MPEMNIAGEPDGGNLHVRFDEGRQLRLAATLRAARRTGRDCRRADAPVDCLRTGGKPPSAAKNTVRAAEGGRSLPGNGGFGAARHLRAPKKADGGTARHRNSAKPLAGAASGGVREGFCKRLSRLSRPHIPGRVSSLRSHPARRGPGLHRKVKTVPRPLIIT